MELYKGTKFKTIFDSKLNADSWLLEAGSLNELRFWCNEFYKYNLTPQYEGGSAGNLSFRSYSFLPTPNSQLPPQFIITATGITSKNIQSNEFFVKVTKCDITNKTIYVEGTREPSSESMLHFCIYQQRNDVNAIFHGHSDTILNNAARLNIPATKQLTPYGSIELIDSVLEIMNKHNFFIIIEHGFVSLAKSMSEAGNLTLNILNKLNNISL